MKIDIKELGEETRLSLSAENQAEEYQLKELSEALNGRGVFCGAWHNYEGKKGICIIVGGDEKLT